MDNDTPRFESFNIRDVPDQWYDIIQAEGNAFFEATSIYPPELVIILIQVIFQNIIYNTLESEYRNKFLVMVFDTFVNQFEEWDNDQADNDA